MGTVKQSLERGLVRGFKRWSRASSLSGKRKASAYIEDALANLEVALEPGYFHKLLRRGAVDLTVVEAWLKSRRA